MRIVVVLLAARSICVAQDLADRYRAAAEKLIDTAMADRDGYAKLEYLCDRIGNRLSGSESLERAIEWARDTMQRDGLSNVRTIPVKVPHWVRGTESARLVEPEDRALHMLGLGMSVGTPPGGIAGDVVVVSDFDELNRLGRAGVQGKIVLFNERFRGYPQTSPYRVDGPSRAAALGAVAALVRSVTPLPMEIPHTGMLSYDPAQPKIPAAAVSVEDALMMARFAEQKMPVKVHLEMNARMEPDADSFDVMGEIPGRERPEEVVVLGGHIDSWDVGQGAQDDGSGIIACLEAVELIKKAGLEPRRTIRVVFWVNEENGVRGGEAYRKWLKGQVRDHVAAIEMDGGAETPRGFGFGGPLASLPTVQRIGKLLDRIGAGEIVAGGGGADIAPLALEGVPPLGVRTDAEHYFDWHHSVADTLDKVDLQEFRKNIASLAVMSYVLADMPGRLSGTPEK
ncbi:MAG TPA: M20/M25/M40 family metallo-hydrolase [Bryobacteraceae bacterium]|nr:M20/M25/M40 family metallo-hydrolase [Bryobacteraceae bacterium]